MTNLTNRADLERARKNLEERFCTVDSPNGPQGIVERVFMRDGRVRAKIILQDGSIAYRDAVEIHPR